MSRTETEPASPNDNEAIDELGRFLLSDVAPAELPLFPAIAQARNSGTTPKQSGRSQDDLLGFGVGEAVVLVAPIVLEFAHLVWTEVSKEVATATAGGVVGVLRRLRDRFSSSSEPKPDPIPTLTDEQLQYVRRVGRDCAAHLPLSDEQQRLMVESLVAALAVPEAPEGAPS